jgi:hypothetical protein
MEILGDRHFVEIPGEKTHELPPLLVKTAPHVKRLDRAVDMAATIIDSEDMIPSLALDSMAGDSEVERRKMDLAINLVDQYLKFVRAWQLGDGIVEWIRQCEITFENRPELRALLRANIWPHAGRASFVELLHDKGVDKPAADPAKDKQALGVVDLERSVGLRLTFRQPPPIGCFSNQFLFYLSSPVATSAYQTWAHMNPPPLAFPPERFTFQVVNMSLD